MYVRMRTGRVSTGGRAPRAFRGQAESESVDACMPPLRPEPGREQLAAIERLPGRGQSYSGRKQAPGQGVCPAPGPIGQSHAHRWGIAWFALRAHLDEVAPHGHQGHTLEHRVVAATERDRLSSVMSQAVAQLAVELVRSEHLPIPNDRFG